MTNQIQNSIVINGTSAWTLTDDYQTKQGFFVLPLRNGGNLGTGTPTGTGVTGLFYYVVYDPASGEFVYSTG